MRSMFCYEMQGRGDPLILVHGYAGTKENFFPLIPLLSEKFMIILFDNRGSGKSDRPDEKITMGQFAQDLIGVMDTLNIESAYIGGASLGGMIAQLAAILFPTRIKRLILINTHYNGTMGEVVKKSSIESLDKQQNDFEQSFWDGIVFMYHRAFRKQLTENPNKK